MSRRFVHLVAPAVVALTLTLGSVPGAAPTSAKEPAASSEAPPASVSDKAATTKAAAGSKSVFSSVLGGFATNLGANVFSLGFNTILHLIFPGPNYQQELENIQQSINQGFSETNAELADIDAALVSLSNQISVNEALTGQDLCQTVREQADAYVGTIQDAYTNYRTALTPAWAAANLTGQTGLSALTVIGNQTFGASTGIPSFASGLNKVSLATRNLGVILNGSEASSGLVAACADAIALSIATTTAGEPAVVGTAETAYFEQLQSVTAYYASWANLGAALSIIGGSMAVLETGVVPPSSAQQAASVCVGSHALPSEALNMVTCGGILAFASTVDQAVDQAWNSTGAGWGQATNGTVATALSRSPSTGFFSGGSTPWLVDVSTYGAGRLLKPGQPGALSSTTTPPASDPRAVDLTSAAANPATLGGLAQATWDSVPFAPATSAQWDQLLQLDTAPFYPGAGAPTIDFSDCLADPSNNNIATSCLDTRGRLSARMSAAQLRNGGSSQAASLSNLIIYTGETTQWNSAESSLPAAVAWYQNAGYPANVPEPTVATYLDTSSVMVSGRSAAINNPNAEACDLTSGDMYPFGSNTNGVTRLDNEYVIAMTLAQSAAAGNGQTTGVQCSDGRYPTGISGQTLMQFLNGTGGAVPAGATATLYCRGNAWSPPGTSTGVPVQSTSNSTFYRQPQAYFAYVSMSGVYLCSTTVGNVPNNGNVTLQSGQGNSTPLSQTVAGYGKGGLTCPDNPWTIPPRVTNGSSSLPTTVQPGWMINAGAGASVAPEAHYGWPVVNLAACPTTSFSQGTTGGSGIGAPNQCSNVFAPYAAAAFGLDTGHLTVITEPFIGPSSGTQSVNLGVVNSSTNSEAATVSMAVSKSLRVSSPLVVTAQTGTQPPQALGSCSVKQGAVGSVSGTLVTCPNVVFPAGSTTLSVVASGSKGSAAVGLAGNGNYSLSVSPLSAGTSSTTLPPGLVTQLAAVVSSSGSNEDVTLSWVPPLSPTSITSYTVKARMPDGTTSSATIQSSSVKVSGGVASITVPLPEPGYWTISVAANNVNGTGPAGFTALTLGDGPPPSPQNLAAKELPNARVLLSWAPIDSSPPLDSYVVSGMSPSGKTQSFDVTAFASYKTPALPETGLWSFSVAARNAAGVSAASIVRINVIGSVPSAVAALSTRVGAGGLVDVSWLAPADAVPPPTSYKIAVFAPYSTGSTPTAVASMTIPAAGLTAMFNIPALYQLGANSPTGIWTVAVQPINGIGSGTPARANFIVTTALKNSLALQASLVQDLQDVLIGLQEIEAAECAAGLSTVSPVTGTCSKGTFTPRG